MEPWQEIVAEYDRKAHKKRGFISVAFIGSFRAMDDPRVANRVLTYGIDPGETHLQVLEQVVFDIEKLMPLAIDLDRRIEVRKSQKPHEREYLYDHETE